MSTFVRLMNVSLIVAVATPAFAITLQSSREQKAQFEKIKSMEVVSAIHSGRQIVKADGHYYIEMPATDLNKLRAEQILRAHRAQMRAALGADDGNQGLTRAQLEDKKNDVHVLADESGYYSTGFYGVSIRGLQKVDGVKFTPSRMGRMEDKLVPYIVAKTDMRQGAVITGSCENPDGHADVLGYNRLRTGCWGALKLFKQFGN